MFVYDKSPRSKVKDECMDHKNLVHFVIHTLTTFSPGGWEPFAKRRDSLNNIARQNRKRKENLESIACAEGQWFVLHSNRATSNLNLPYVGATNQLR